MCVDYHKPFIICCNSICNVIMSRVIPWEHDVSCFILRIDKSTINKSGTLSTLSKERNNDQNQFLIEHEYVQVLRGC